MLIDILSNEYIVIVNIMPYADDFSAAGNLQDQTKWGSALTEIGPKFVFYPKTAKTWLLFKSLLRFY